MWWPYNGYKIPAFKSHLPLSVRMATSYDFSIARFIFTTSFEKYWAFSGAASLDLWKHIVATGGLVYSSSLISPIIEIGFSPVKDLKVSLGYHRKKESLFSEDEYNSIYSLASSISF